MGSDFRVVKAAAEEARRAASGQALETDRGEAMMADRWRMAMQWERTEDRTKFEDTFEVIFYYYMYLSENLISLKVTLTQRRRLQRPQRTTNAKRHKANSREQGRGGR